jgi:hypothetical protein
VTHPRATDGESTGTVPEFLRAFVDDAATFPPASTPLDVAVAEHRAHLRSEYADLVGGFLVSDVRIADLAAVVVPPEVEEEAPVSASTPLPVNLVVTGGAGAIEPAVTWLTRSEGLELRALEFALRDEDDLAHNARRLVHVLDSLEDVLVDVPVFAEPPMLRGDPSHGWLSALDELAAREVALKFRTGGVTEDLFPSARALATSLEAALDRELAFKCTAGLHHAIHHRDEATGLEHHGFLNVLLATRASLDGEGIDGVAAVLEETAGEELAGRLSADPDQAARTRRWFTSFGSCSVLEAHEDLVELGLLR